MRASVLWSSELSSLAGVTITTLITYRGWRVRFLRRSTTSWLWFTGRFLKHHNHTLYFKAQRTWTMITVLLLTSYLMTLHKSKRWKNYYCYVPRSNIILLLLVRTHQWKNNTHISSENNLPVKNNWCTYYRYAINYDTNRCYEYGVFHDRFKLPLMMVVVFKTCLGEKLMLLDVKLFLGVKKISPLKISSKPESNTYVYT